VRYRKGSPCHLRLTLRLALLDGAGRRLPVAGNPATTTVEGDLPEDQMQWLEGSWVIDGPFMWRFAWEEWCNQGLPAATLRVTAEGGATLTSPGPRHSATKQPAALGDCQDRGRPSTLAACPRCPDTLLTSGTSCSMTGSNRAGSCLQVNEHGQRDG